MPARISIPVEDGNAEARIEFGEWIAARPDVLRLVRQTAATDSATDRDYTPDRDAHLARVVAGLLGGEVVEVYRLPDQVDPPPGTVF